MEFQETEKGPHPVCLSEGLKSMVSSLQEKGAEVWCSKW
jgi:hypothetical protein